jgi:hypothetical protein
MIRIGVTGHTDLTEPTAHLVYDVLVRLLDDYPDEPVRGISCLAEGADQIFAQAVLAARGSLEVILPACDYRLAAIGPSSRPGYDGLLRKARRVSRLPYKQSGDVAYAAASSAMLRRCDRLLAIWDGRPHGRCGGTAHTVALAGAAGIPVCRLWPSGAQRRGAALAGIRRPPGEPYLP